MSLNPRAESKNASKIISLLVEFRSKLLLGNCENASRVETGPRLVFRAIYPDKGKITYEGLDVEPQDIVTTVFGKLEASLIEIEIWAPRTRGWLGR